MYKIERLAVGHNRNFNSPKIKKSVNYTNN